MYSTIGRSIVVLIVSVVLSSYSFATETNNVMKDMNSALNNADHSKSVAELYANAHRLKIDLENAKKFSNVRNKDVYLKGIKVVSYEVDLMIDYLRSNDLKGAKMILQHIHNLENHYHYLISNGE